MEPMSTRALCQLEFHSQRLEASLDFFRDIFGWPPLPMALQEYTVLEVPSDSPYGVSLISAPAEHSARQTLVPYFSWDSLEELLEKVLRAGGKLVAGPRLLPGYGRTVLVEDPGGIQLGFFTAKT